MPDFDQEVDAERKHVLDMLLAATTRQGMSKLARKELQEVPGLSFTQIFGHLRFIVGHGRALGDLRAFPIQCLNWESPAQSITGGLIYTYLCLNPHLLTCIPVGILLTGVFIPNYARRYPRDPNLMPVKPSSLSELDDEGLEELIVKQRHEQAERDIMQALKQGQASLAKVCQGLEKLDDFIAGPGNFANPGQSSSIFVLLMFLLFNTAFVTSLVPIPYVFIAVGWTVLVTANPKVKKWLASMETPEFHPTLVRDTIQKMTGQFDYSDAPVQRQVEIFEIQKQGLTAKHWDRVMYSPEMFTPDSSLRQSLSLPEGEKYLFDVEPPLHWRFDSEHTWEEDRDARQWSQDRSVPGVPDGAWLYDDSGEWRRRRLTRICYYAPK